MQIINPALQYRKRVQITLAAGAVAASTAHGLGSVPVPGRPNPSRMEGVNSWATADAANVTVNLDVGQVVAIDFDIPLFL